MNDKKQLIEAIEKSRNSKLLVYVTGDRKPFATKIADDVMPVIGRHLSSLENPQKISLFLYTRGGDLVTPLRLVKLIRSISENFEVIVPYRAHSAGTLIALGADKVLMGRLAELSPTDASTMHPFNPSDPAKSERRLEISVEDINSYFLLAKEKAGVEESQMLELFKLLSEKVHPLSLGNAYRALRMAKQVAQKLLSTHIEDEKLIDLIVKAVTQDLCIHGYPITRDEAGELGMKIEVPSEDLEYKIWQLYECYAQEMKLGVPFHPEEVLRGKELAEFTYCGAVVESRDLGDKFMFEGKVRKTFRDGKPVMDVNVELQKWKPAD